MIASRDVRFAGVVASPTVERIGIVGLGYIGLPTAVVFADHGFETIGFDIRAEVVETINSGRIHIYEEGLADRVASLVSAGKLRASTALEICDVYIIAVPTPIKPDKSPDLEAVKAASRAVGEVLKPGDLVIVESTIPPRTCLDVVAPEIEAACGLSHLDNQYGLAHCPERVLPGRILHELIANDRIVGGTTPESTQRAARLYEQFVKGAVLRTTATTAETCKLMENTFRDVNIALANELASICHAIGIDSAEAIALANRHPRVNIHQPGIGVGGHCIPVDPWFIVHAAPDLSRLIAQSRSQNDERPRLVAERILDAADPQKPILLYGLSFKPDVDDLRESPAVEIAELVASRFSGGICVVEPHCSVLPDILRHQQNLRQVSIEVATETDGLHVLLVRHRAFRDLAIAVDAAQLW